MTGPRAVRSPQSAVRSIEITTAAEAAARDRETIAGGISSRLLMQRAGLAAAAAIQRRFSARMLRGVAIFAGPGNNGGDAWVVAGALADAGYKVFVSESGESKTDDARAEREAARKHVRGTPTGDEQLVVDGLLGSGSSGEPRGAIAEAVERINLMRMRGAKVVALDVPTGVDATTGGGDTAVTADVTLCFGTMKRGCLIARGRCGRIEVLDIGLTPRTAVVEPPIPLLVDGAFVDQRIPPLAVSAHKGERRRLAIVGGNEGMAGATIFAARAAMRSGIGLVKLFVHRDSIPVVQTAAYQAIAEYWPDSDADVRGGLGAWAHGALIGPGLGNSPDSRKLVERVLREFHGPVVLDADALNVFEGDAPALAKLLGGRPALITPHVAEFARLSGRTPDEVLANRFDVALDLARDLGCVVLLKGVPTIVTDPAGRRLVSARGTPVLAAGGSGDLLAGMAATLITQAGEAFEAAACAAFVHGVAGELATRGRPARGVALNDVERALAHAWGIRFRLPDGAIAVLPGVRG